MNHIYINRLKGLLIAGALMLSGVAGAQQGSITGTIATVDGKAAEYVNISIKGTNKGTTSDVDGKFEIRKVAPGSHILLASFVGFDPIEKSVEVRAGEVTNVDFVLNETSAQLVRDCSKRRA